MQQQHFEMRRQQQDFHQKTECANVSLWQEKSALWHMTKIGGLGMLLFVLLQATEILPLLESRSEYVFFGLIFFGLGAVGASFRILEYRMWLIPGYLLDFCFVVFFMVLKEKGNDMQLAWMKISLVLILLCFLIALGIGASRYERCALTDFSVFLLGVLCFCIVSRGILMLSSIPACPTLANSNM